MKFIQLMAFAVIFGVGSIFTLRIASAIEREVPGIGRFVKPMAVLLAGLVALIVVRKLGGR